MDLELLRSLCLAHAGVTEDIKWEHDLCFCVGGKMFLVTAPDEIPTGASLKCSMQAFEGLLERPGFSPAPYLARAQWVAVDDLNRMSRDEWEERIAEAYRLVYEKLPRKVQQQVLTGG